MRQSSQDQFTFIDVSHAFTHKYALVSSVINYVLLSTQMKVNILVKDVHDQNQLVEFGIMHEKLHSVDWHFHLELIAQEFSNLWQS